MSADNWQCPNCANVVSTLSAACDNCGYDRRTMPDPTRREPKTSPERAELQVSLLNEIGLTLTAMAKEQVAQREVFKCLSLQLQAIDNDLAAKWATRLAQIEERLDKFDVWFDSWNELRAAALEAGQMEIRQMQAKQRTSSSAAANNQKPRKAGKRKGKRPVRKSS